MVDREHTSATVYQLSSLFSDEDVLQLNVLGMWNVPMNCSGLQEVIFLIKYFSLFNLW